MWNPYLVAEAVLDQIARALADGRSDPVLRRYVSAGQVAFDQPHQLTVGQVGRVYRSVVFPSEERGAEVDGYGGLWVVPLAVVLVRCVPVMTDTGQAPTAGALAQAHACLYRDGALIANSLTGVLPDVDWERGQVTQEYIGGLGGLIAVDTRVILGVDAEDWCP